MASHCPKCSLSHAPDGVTMLAQHSIDSEEPVLQITQHMKA